MPLNKEERAKCWKARDDYWACLDAAEAKKPVDPAEPERLCKELHKIFSSQCPSQWVKHFERKRKFDVFKKQIQENGFEPIQEQDDKSRK